MKRGETRSWRSARTEDQANFSSGGEGLEAEREGEATADGFVEEAEGVGDPKDRAGHGIEELVEVGLVREILTLVVRTGIEEASASSMTRSSRVRSIMRGTRWR
jgi:hypothetical protein